MKLPDKFDNKPPKEGWAPGKYLGKCSYCNEWFFGDKRSFQCADCAYGENQK